MRFSKCLKPSHIYFKPVTFVCFFCLRSMDKYARLMQKLELVNVEFLKVPIQILGIFADFLYFFFVSKEYVLHLFGIL